MGVQALGVISSGLFFPEDGRWVEVTRIDHYIPTDNTAPLEGVDQEKFKKRRTITLGKVDEVRSRLESEMAIRHVLELRTFERGREQGIAEREQRQERLLD